MQDEKFKFARDPSLTRLDQVAVVKGYGETTIRARSSRCG